MGGVQGAREETGEGGSEETTVSLRFGWGCVATGYRAIVGLTFRFGVTRQMHAALFPDPVFLPYGVGVLALSARFSPQNPNSCAWRLACWLCYSVAGRRFGVEPELDSTLTNNTERCLS